MDPFSALGLAVNLIQLLEFGSKIVTGGIELYKSSSGASSANEGLEFITNNLAELCTSLTGPDAFIQPGRTSKSEVNLLELSKQCKELNEELLSILNGLKVSGRHKKWQSLRQALNSVMKEKEIRNYRDRLSEYRSQLMLHLIGILGSGQSRVNVALEALSASHSRLEILAVNEPARLRREIIEALQVLKRSSYDANAIDKLESQLSGLAIQGNALTCDLKMIETLCFDMIFERELQVKEAHPSTFHWILNDYTEDREHVTVFKWLKSGQGVYWVSGKAGSGKSTFMKFLVEQPETEAALRSWAGEKQLIIARYFFWNAGTEMQKSQRGLLQTLLYHVLRQSPKLAPKICPDRWESFKNSESNPTVLDEFPWTYRELARAFECLKSHAVNSARFCFFIDGLDEFDGVHEELIETIQSMVLTNNIKIIFSSRPWNCFESSFGLNNGNKLKVHDFTRPDIDRFVRDNLCKDEHFRKLKANDDRYESLVLDIVERANGVFLWVFLVVRSLRRGLSNSDTIKELQQRLWDLPTDLDTFFRHMLDSAEKIYHRSAARILLICLSMKHPPAILTMSFFDEDDPDFGLGSATTVSTIAEARGRLDDATISKRIKVRCTDLLEVNPRCAVGDSSKYPRHVVSFLHRTVTSFLRTGDIEKLLLERAGLNFDSLRFICNALLSQMRLIAVFARQESPNSFTPYGCLRFLVEDFFNYAHEIELRGSFDITSLVDMVGSSIESIRDAQKHRYSESWSYVAVSLTDRYSTNWLIELAVRRRLYGYLRRKIPQVRHLIQNPECLFGGLLLDMALRPNSQIWVGDHYAKHDIKPDSNVVTLLLEQGASPNEIPKLNNTRKPNEAEIKQEPVWARYLGDRNMHCWEPQELERSFNIIERLLLKGANFGLDSIPLLYLEHWRDEQINRVRVLCPVNRGEPACRALSIAESLKKRRKIWNGEPDFLFEPDLNAEIEESGRGSIRSREGA